MNGTPLSPIAGEEIESADWRHPRGPWLGLVLSIALLLLFAGLGALAFSAVPFGVLKHILTRFSAEGHAKRVNFEFYSSLLLPLRFGAALLIVSAVACWSLRYSLANRLARVWIAARLKLQRLAAAFWQWAVSENRTHLLFLTAVLLGGIVIRIVYLGQTMRYDEAFTYLKYASKPLPYALTVDYQPNDHWLHTILVWLSVRLFSDSLIAIRLPALLAGVALIPATYWYCRKYARSAAALLAASFLSVSTAAILYSTNARGYTLIALLFLGLMGVSLHLTQTGGREGWWAAFVALAVLSMYTSPTAVYGLAVSVVVIVAGRLRRSGWRQFKWRDIALSLGISAVITTILYWPTIVGSGFAALFENRFIKPIYGGDRIQQIGHSFVDSWNLWHAGWPIWITILLHVGVAIAVVMQGKRFFTVGRVFLLALAVCFAGAVAQHINPPARVWLFLLPLYFCAAAAGLQAALDRLIPRCSDLALNLTAVGILIAGGAAVLRSGEVTKLPETGLNGDVPRLAAILRKDLRPDDLILTTVPSAEPLEYYLKQDGLKSVHADAPGLRDIRQLSRHDPSQVFAVIDKSPSVDLAQRLKTVWNESGVPISEFKPDGKVFDSPHTVVFRFDRVR